jgi:hypothetical protein
MLGEVQKLSIAQEDGASPKALGEASALSETGVCAPCAEFEGAMRVGATSRRPSLL